MFNIFLDAAGIVKEENDFSCVMLGDSLSLLKKIKSGSIDLIFADPPYGLGKDFGITKDVFINIEEYTAWCILWIDECMRILKPAGTMYFMASCPRWTGMLTKNILLSIVLSGCMTHPVYSQNQNLVLCMSQYS
jgi:DNA modification methylase